jgi:hypothetical protein
LARAATRAIGGGDQARKTMLDNEFRLKIIVLLRAASLAERGGSGFARASSNMACVSAMQRRSGAHGARRMEFACELIHTSKAFIPQHGLHSAGGHLP